MANGRQERNPDGFLALPGDALESDAYACLNGSSVRTGTTQWSSSLTDTPIYRAKTISMSKTGGRKPCTLLKAAQHNLRDFKLTHDASHRIDRSLSPQNLVLDGPCSASEVQILADQIVGQVNDLRLKKDHVQAIESLFSVPSGFLDYECYFRQCLQWAAMRLQLPVLNAVIHVDESNPHLHVLQVPVRDGRHVGGAPIARTQLPRLRKLFFDEVAGPAGFQRPHAKLRGELKAFAAEAVLAEAFKRGLDLQSAEFWPTLKDGISRDPLSLVKSLGIDLDALRRRQLSP